MRAGIHKIFTFILFCINLHTLRSQDTLEMWVNISPELKMTFEDRIWEVRFRPDDHIILPEKYIPNGNQAKIELMLGLNAWKFKIFSHSKYDQNGGFWTGIRFDFNFTALNQKLLFNIQERYFIGLNDKSKDHYYLVQYIRYKITKASLFGLFSYGKWTTGRDFNTGNWFIGPSIALSDNSGLGLQFALTKDVFFDKRFMTFIRISYEFAIKNNSKIITIDTDS